MKPRQSRKNIGVVLAKNQNLVCIVLYCISQTRDIVLDDLMVFLMFGVGDFWLGIRPTGSQGNHQNSDPTMLPKNL